MDRMKAFCRTYGVDTIWWLGCAATVAVTALRVIMAPSSRDPETGHFAVNMVAIIVALAAVAVMAVFVLWGDKRRVEIGREASVPLAGVAIAAGAVIALRGMYDLFAWLLYQEVPPPLMAMTSAVPVWLFVLTTLLAIAGGVVLYMFARQLLMERGTAAGMCTWEMLVPVMWAWLRLMRYLMSYASAVSLDECLYNFAMYVAELLFLFKLARYVSGVGEASVSSMLAHAMSVLVLSLSAVLVRFSMYLLGDTQAYLASQLAGLPDLAIGALALAVAIALWRAARQSPASSEESADTIEV